MKPACVLKACLALAVAVLMPTAALCQGPGACSSPQYRQFDFWVGDWEVFEKDATTSSAHVRVERILDGCVLREHYEDKSGTVGESFTIYNAARKLWHQTWVTNRGRLLTIEGGQKAGSMVLAGSYYTGEGQEVRVRGTWTPTKDGVRESAVTSTDAGKTWKPWFDLMFQPRHRRSSRGLP